MQSNFTIQSLGDIQLNDEIDKLLERNRQLLKSREDEGQRLSQSGGAREGGFDSQIGVSKSLTRVGGGFQNEQPTRDSSEDSKKRKSPSDTDSSTQALSPEIKVSSYASFLNTNKSLKR